MCIRTGSLPNSRAAPPLCSTYIFKFDVSTRLHQMFRRRAPAAGRHRTHGTQIKTREDPSAFNMWGTWSHLYRGDLSFAPKNGGSGTSEQLSEQHKVKKLGGKSPCSPKKLLYLDLSQINAFVLYQHLLHVCALFAEKSAHNSTLPGFPE